MVEWLDANILYWHWIVFGFCLAGLEIFAPSFFFLWLGVSATVVGLISLGIDIPFYLSISLWGGISLLSLFLWFKFISPMMKDKITAGMSLEALIGQEGLAIESSGDSKKGRLRFSAPIVGNDEWNFRAESIIKAGDKVIVKSVNGNDLFVFKKNIKE